jgi:ABC-type oligopeptide transport system ATPase subunit
VAEPAPLVEVRDLRKSFVGRDGTRRTAVDGVSFAMQPGETLGLAGTSSAGKSTIGRMILDLIAPDSGTVLFAGQPVRGPDDAGAGRRRARMQMVFQNPVASMNPRRTAAATIELPMRNLAIGTPAERRARVGELLDLVGLSPRHANYYPHEFSGGQCQRLGIARALATDPRFIFLDEPVSALDVSVQAQILNLLKALQERLGLTYLFVANNLNVARFMCDRIAILDAGRIVELDETDRLFTAPRHDLTRRLVSAIMSLDRAGA